MHVLKRDKTLEEFQFDKIESAIQKAFESCEVPVNKKVIECMRSRYSEDDDVNVCVEDIQDAVEDCLMQWCPPVAKKYIIYRYEHKVIRENRDKLIKGLTKKLMADDIENQNANVDEHSFGGRMGEASRLVTKDYALNYCMSRKSRRNHQNNEIYIHDLDSYAVGEHNCLSEPFDDLLSKGFNTRQTDVRPANSINTAFQLVAVLFQLQSLQQFGGVSATHLDWTMVPYVRKSFFKHYTDNYIHQEANKEGINFLDMTDVEIDTYKNKKREEFKKEFGIKDETFTIGKFSMQCIDFHIDGEKPKSINKEWYNNAVYDTINELKQAVEGMYHNLNTLQSRSGNQLPFTSINYGTCTLIEGRMVIKALLEGSIRGVGKFHKTPIFPCGIFQVMKGVNKEDGTPNYDMYQLALKSTSKRLYPNYANVDWSGNAGYDVNDPRTYFSTMGCRTANGWDINGFGQLKDGRGNICPVTIILPTLAMEAKEYVNNKATKENRKYTQDEVVNKFISILDKKIEEAKDMLLERFEWICKQSPASARFMWENNTMTGYIPEEGIRSALRHGTLAIGQIAVAETLQILIGTDQTTDKGMELADMIEQLFKKRCAEFKEKYKLNFGVYYTPAENLCHTALKKFRDTYGIIPNVSDREYFTNSMHVPVWHKITPFEKIDIESKLTGYSSAGCITYVELDSSVLHNIESLETIVNYAMEHDIPYFAINIPNDLCNDCGYTGDINDVCPKCGGTNILRLRRVTGYLTGDYKTSFNYGKQCETEDRAKHTKEI